MFASENPSLKSWNLVSHLIVNISSLQSTFLAVNPILQE